MKINNLLLSLYENGCEPEPCSLKHIIDVYENPDNIEEFMKARCMLLGLTIKKEPALKEFVKCVCTYGHAPAPVNKYGFPNQLKYLF